jgi:hypothetical protein
VTSIGAAAFAGCGAITVDPNNMYYSSIDGVLFNKSMTMLIACTISKAGTYTAPSTVTAIGAGAFMGCRGLTSIILSSSVSDIGYVAFSYCTGLTSITIPISVTHIGGSAFQGCYRLSSMTVAWSTPPDISSSPNIFLDANNCTLYVPYGTSVLYRAANQWKDLANIVEDSEGFLLSTTTANIGATEGSNTTVQVTANVAWTASSDQTWLTVSPTSGTGNGTLTFTAEYNPSIAPRSAKVAVLATGVDSQTITLTQAGSNAPLSITAGSLVSALTPEQRSTITKLTLIGSIDARDFKTMRDEMPVLAEVDISGVTIAAYTVPFMRQMLFLNLPFIPAALVKA